MAQALRLSRIGSGLGIGLWKEAWRITIDGAVVGEIGHQETVEVVVAPARHPLRLGEGRHVSPERSCEVSRNETVSFRCDRPRFWPQLVAAQLKPELWISLRPE